MMKIDEQIKNIKEKNENRLKYDFMAPLLEIVERPANKWGVAVILVLVALFVSLGLWSYFAEVDIVAVAGGVVVPDGNAKIVQPFQGGIVNSILVVEGDKVKKGDLLIELDAHMINIEISKLKNELEDVKREKKLYEEILAGKSVGDDGSPLLSKILSEYELLEKKVDAININIEELKISLDNQNNEKNNIQNQISNNNQQKDLFISLINAGGVEQQKLNEYYRLRSQYETELSYTLETDPLYNTIMLSIQTVNQQIALQEVAARTENTLNNINLIDYSNNNEELAGALNRVELSISQINAEIDKSLKEEINKLLSNPLQFSQVIYASTVLSISLHKNPNRKACNYPER